MRSATQSWWANVIQNKLIACVIALVVAMPLIATPLDNRLHGAAALTLEVTAIALLGLLLWRSSWDLRREKVMAFLKSGANLPVLLFSAWAAVSWFHAPHKDYATQELLRVLAGVMLYFVVAYQFKRSEYLSKLVDALLGVSILVSLVGFAQYSLGSGDRAVGFFGNDQLLGSFLMLLLPFAIVVATTEKSTGRQLTAQIATILSAACLLLANSRSAWIGALGAVLALGVLSLIVQRKQGRTSSQRRAAVLPIMMLVVSIGLFLLMWAQSGSIYARATTLGSIGHDHTLLQRVQMWTGGLSMAMQHPIAGWGIGQYPVYQKAFTGWGISPSGMRLHPTLAEQAHNVYIQLAAELGFVGLLLFALILIRFLTAGAVRIRTMDPGLRRNLLLAAVAATVAFSIDAIGSPSWQFGQLSMFLWLTLGIGASCSRNAVRREELAPAPAAPRAARPAAVVSGLALVSLLPSVVCAGAGGNYSSTDNTAAIVGGVAGAGLVAGLVLTHGHLFGGGAPASLVADLTPKDASIAAGDSQAYHLFVNINGVNTDVTNNPGTTFAEVGGHGYMTGPNNSIYQSVPGESDHPTIIATYNGMPVDKPASDLSAAPGSPRGNERTFAASTGLTVH